MTGHDMTRQDKTRQDKTEEKREGLIRLEKLKETRVEMSESIRGEKETDRCE